MKTVINRAKTVDNAYKTRDALEASIADEGIIELPGVHAECLRLLCEQLERGESEIESLCEYGTDVHRALCEATDIEDIEDIENLTVVLVFVHADTPFCPEGLTPRQASDIAVYLLDEVE